MLEKILSRPLVPICILYWSALLFSVSISIHIVCLIVTITCIILFFIPSISYSIKYIIWISSLLLILFNIRTLQHHNNYHYPAIEDRLILKEYQFQINEIESRDSNTSIIASFKYLNHVYTAAIKLKNKTNYSSLIPDAKVTLNATLFKNTNKENYEDFNYSKYLERKHIQYTGTIYEDSVCHVSTSTSIFSSAYITNKHLQSSLSKSINNLEIANLIIAILLGDKSNVTEKIKNQFISTGTAHILAVSGMHLGILYGIIKYIIHFIGYNKKKKSFAFALLTILIIWAFAFVTGLGSSVVRAAVMFSLLELGINLRRTTDSVNILFGTGFIMSYYNPCTIYDIGFQLSFSAVLSIILFYPIINRSYRSTSKFTNYILEIIWLSISVQILITPISVYYFHSFPSYFILANILWIPISTILMLLGIGIFIIQPIFTIPSHILGYLTEYLTKLGLAIFDFIETLPLHNISNLYFNELQLICLLACMFCLFWWIKYSHNTFLFTGIASCIIFTFIPVANMMNDSSENGLICYSNNNYPLFETKIHNNIYSFQDEMIKKTSYFRKQYPLAKKNQYIFDYKYPQVFTIESDRQNEKYFIAYDSLPKQFINVLVLKNRKFSAEKLKEVHSQKIILHPKASFYLKNHYKSVKDSTKIEDFENYNYKTNL